MGEFKKPPLGLAPQEIAYEKWRYDRSREIAEAVQRYLDDGETPIPTEWISEYNALVGVWKVRGGESDG
jgi:hypothetical protein